MFIIKVFYLRTDEIKHFWIEVNWIDKIRKNAAKRRQHKIKNKVWFWSKHPAVVYFNQLPGAGHNRKLIEIMFLPQSFILLFNLLMSFSSFLVWKKKKMWNYSIWCKQQYSLRLIKFVYNNLPKGVRIWISCTTCQYATNWATFAIILCIFLIVSKK